MSSPAWIQEQAAELDARGRRTSGGPESPAPTRPKRSSACADRSCRSARSAGSAPSASGDSSPKASYVNALGALTGGQAVQMVKAGLKAIYLSGWQVAADANLAGATYPDQSLYPANSVPQVVRRMNNALLRADQIDWSEGRTDADWLAPIVADAEAGFGGPLNAYELMRALIEAGAAGVHFEDQLAAEKKCGHLGGKVLVPTSQFIRTLTAARLAADVARRADRARRAHRRAQRDAPDERRRRVRPAVRHRRAHDRGLLPRRPTGSTPRSRARSRTRRTPTCSGSRRRRPISARRASSRRRSTRSSRASCSPTTARRRSTGRRRSTTRRSRLPAAARRVGLPLPVHHARRLPRAERRACSSSPVATANSGMSAYVELQEREFAMEADGYTATKHQREVGAGYFDLVMQAVVRRRELDARAPRVDGGGAIRVED